MAIDSISSTAAPLPEISPLVDKTKKLPATPTAESDAAAAATSTQAATTSTPATPPPAAAAAPPAAPVQSEAAAVSTATATLDSTYSTTVGGKSYSANVSETNGTYTLAVPGLPGASVSGTSLSSAEAALGVKIDTLV
jgi:hypothetical protein